MIPYKSIQKMYYENRKNLKIPLSTVKILFKILFILHEPPKGTLHGKSVL